MRGLGILLLAGTAMAYDEPLRLPDLEGTGLDGFGDDWGPTGDYTHPVYEGWTPEHGGYQARWEAPVTRLGSWAKERTAAQRKVAKRKRKAQKKARRAGRGR